MTARWPAEEDPLTAVAMQAKQTAEAAQEQARRVLDGRWRRAVWHQTPISVWDEYSANGYTTEQVLAEEIATQRGWA